MACNQIYSSQSTFFFNLLAWNKWQASVKLVSINLIMYFESTKFINCFDSSKIRPSSQIDCNHVDAYYDFAYMAQNLKSVNTAFQPHIFVFVFIVIASSSLSLPVSLSLSFSPKALRIQFIWLNCAFIIDFSLAHNNYFLPYQATFFGWMG